MAALSSLFVAALALFQSTTPNIRYRGMYHRVEVAEKGD